MDPIDVFAMARNHKAWEGQVPLARLARLCTSLTDGPGDRAGVLQYRCRAGLDGHGRPSLNLVLAAVLPLRCDRCAQKLDLPLAADRDFFFVATEAELAAIPVDDAPEEALLGSGQFDLAGLIEDEAILQLPLSPRHPDCRPAAGPMARQSGPAQADDTAGGAGRPKPFAGLAALRASLHHTSAKTAQSPDVPAAPRPRGRKSR